MLLWSWFDTHPRLKYKCASVQFTTGLISQRSGQKCFGLSEIIRCIYTASPFSRKKGGEKKKRNLQMLRKHNSIGQE